MPRGISWVSNALTIPSDSGIGFRLPLGVALRKLGDSLKLQFAASNQMESSSTTGPKTTNPQTTVSNGEKPARRTLRRVLIGPPRDVRDPEIFHSLSLIAFLAWAGLGSDALGSSCYAPAQASLALGQHH